MSKALNLPNSITLSRFVLALAFVYVFFIDNMYAKIAAFMIVVISEITDLADGKIARARNEVTQTGKLLDPLADSVSRLTVFICFAAYATTSYSYVSPVWQLENIHLVPVWMVVLVVFRELLVSSLRTFAATQGIILSARKSGKIKAATQSASILIILFLVILHYFIPKLPLNALSFFIMLITTLVTLWSGAEYFISNKKVIMQLR